MIAIASMVTLLLSFQLSMSTVFFCAHRFEIVGQTSHEFVLKGNNFDRVYFEKWLDLWWSSFVRIRLHCYGSCLCSLYRGDQLASYGQVGVGTRVLCTNAPTGGASSSGVDCALQVEVEDGVLHGRRRGRGRRRATIAAAVGRSLRRHGERGASPRSWRRPISLTG